MKYDVAVIGASIGGVMAALSAAKSGYKVVLTEKTDWIGGQLTSQAVPPDEHKYIETTGCTATYRAYRNKVRDYYRNHPFIIDELKTKDYFCPGGSSVSRLSHPPKLALEILLEMVKPFEDNKSLTIMLETTLKTVKSDGEKIYGLTVEKGGASFEITAEYYIDGTDDGSLIALSKTEYVTGAESRNDTNEIHAPIDGDKEDMQPITWVGAVDYDKNPKACHVMDKPPMYDYFKKMKMPYDKYNVLSMFGPDSSTGKAKRFGFFNNEIGENNEELFGLFTYRRIVRSANFKDNYEPKDITLINWPQNDFFMDNVFDSKDDAYNEYLAKQLTLSFIYYLQTEAPRENGGYGYRGLSLRGDVLGTADGLAKAPYIRESRRIKAKKIITENMISKRTNSSMPYFSDTVGVGSYHIDIHITTRSHSFFFDDTYPFQIPLGAMIPVKMTNLIPACKNIGTTHLTNGCYRLHPIEWNIGEVAGYLAAYSIKNKVSICEVYENKVELKKFQEQLKACGVQLEWKL